MQRAPLLPLVFCALLPACGGGGSETAAPGATSARWHVSAGAPAGGDGTTWARSFARLEDAFEAARPGDEIWVARGVYRPAGPNGDRNAAFHLPSRVSVWGGFDGDESQRTQRDWVAHPTILSGDLNGDDGPDWANTQENSFQVVVAVDCALGTILDGFTIRGGRADGPGLGPTPDSRDQGSGANIYGGAPRFENCVFEANWSANHGTANDHGDMATWVACTFRDNRSERFGAGLYVHHHSMTMAMDCTFRGNVAGGEGAGAYCRSLHGARFEGCAFLDNAAQRGAGLYCADGSTPEVIGCAFQRNAASVGGGGLYADLASPWIESCEFTDNLAGDLSGGGGGEGGGGGSGGGGVWVDGGAPVTLDCAFRGNRASFGGGFYAIFDSLAVVSGCTFEGNTATEAGGLYTLTAPILVEDCLFVDNVASGGSFSVGGGLSNYFSASHVRRCTFRGNRADLGGGGLYNEGSAPIVELSRFEGNESVGAQGFGGGLLNGFHTHSRVQNCTFVGNRARRGGGVYELAFSRARVVNCTIAGNLALEAGGGVFAAILVEANYGNCIVHGNTPNAIGGDPLRVGYSCVEGGREGEGNLDGDPLFLRAPSFGPDGAFGGDDDDHGDLRLAAGSPCLDAGRNRYLWWLSETDLAGAARYVDDWLAPNVGLGYGALVDMGAFERAPSVETGR